MGNRRTRHKNALILSQASLWQLSPSSVLDWPTSALSRTPQIRRRQRQQRLLQRAQVLCVHVEDHLQRLPGVENRPPEGAQRGGRVDDVGVLPPDEPVANLALLLLADELLLEERRGRGEYKQFGVIVEVLLA